MEGGKVGMTEGEEEDNWNDGRRVRLEWKRREREGAER